MVILGHTQTHTRIHTETHTQRERERHTHTHTHTHTRTHTHTHTRLANLKMFLLPRMQVDCQQYFRAVLIAASSIFETVSEEEIEFKVCATQIHTKL